MNTFAYDEELGLLADDLRFTYISKKQLLCEGDSVMSSPLILDGKLFTYDTHHLSLDAANYLGRELKMAYGDIFPQLDTHKSVAKKMKLTIDTVENTIYTHNADGDDAVVPVYSKEGFKLLSEIWLKQEWNQLHWQSFSWFGYQIWQFPEDLLRLHEVVVSLAPDVIVETGVNRGGSAIFFASMCRLLGKGRVISIDIQIPAEVRQAVEQSPFSDLITLIEGDSASPEIVGRVRDEIGEGEKVFVFLDSDHSKAHVLRELHAYSGMVTPGSYIVATDGVMQSLTDTPYGREEWLVDNPAAAAREFAACHPEFSIKRPTALFGDQYIVEGMTYWPDAWLYRVPVTKGD